MDIILKKRIFQRLQFFAFTNFNPSTIKFYYHQRKLNTIMTITSHGLVLVAFLILVQTILSKKLPDITLSDKAQTTCSTIGGKCINTLLRGCRANTMTGWCPGKWYIRCCTSLGKNVSCGDLGGVCKNVADCHGDKIDWKCKGDNSIKCCIPWKRYMKWFFFWFHFPIPGTLLRCSSEYSTH